MKVILSILFLGYVSGQVPIGSRWKELKSPLDTPHYHDIMKKMFPTVTERNHRSGRIAGGDFATLGQFPFQALLMNENSLGDSFLCGGSLISPNWILTAAHCLNNIVQVSIYLGIVDLNRAALYGVTITDRSNLIMHEGYVSDVSLNDIGVIRVLDTILIDPFFYTLISLPLRFEVSEPLEGKIATIAGFGKFTDYLESQFLLFADIKIVANSVCEAIFMGQVHDTNLCLQGTGGKSSCQGDSGGGLSLVMNGRRVVVGIVSFGAHAGCTLNYPVVYTKVASYLDWIHEKTGLV